MRGSPTVLVLGKRQREFLQKLIGPEARLVLVRDEDGNIEIRRQVKINPAVTMIAPGTLWCDEPLDESRRT